MKNKRRIHSAEFKARIALEAVKRHETVQQIAAENEVHPTQVTQWNSQMLGGVSEGLSGAGMCFRWGARGRAWWHFFG